MSFVAASGTCLRVRAHLAGVPKPLTTEIYLWTFNNVECTNTDSLTFIASGGLGVDNVRTRLEVSPFSRSNAGELDVGRVAIAIQPVGGKIFEDTFRDVDQGERIRACPGVNAQRPFGSFKREVRGRELRISST
ncbi:hypothetical protein J6590_069156 [Homalodisca vitripennis]|nr:hypothetical protein J6590_069156 [Homalodisca vitripennis]